MCMHVNIVKYLIVMYQSLHQTRQKSHNTVPTKSVQTLQYFSLPYKCWAAFIHPAYFFMIAIRICMWYIDICSRMNALTLLAYTQCSNCKNILEKPTDLCIQSSTWSNYKHHSTAKFLVACTRVCNRLSGYSGYSDIRKNLSVRIAI